MDSAQTKREQAKREQAVADAGKRRVPLATRANWPLTLNDAHSPALSVGPAFGSSHAVLPRGLQAKLTVNTPGDQYEQEADRVAEQVMRMNAPDVSPRKLEGESREEYPNHLRLQRRARSEDGASAETAPSVVDEVLQSPGQRLDPATQRFMESRFNEDLSQVRVHTDASAGESSRSINALAYTVGHDVVFAPGRYAPQTTPGRKLLAHELTHVLQQRASAPTPGPIAAHSAETLGRNVDPLAGPPSHASDAVRISMANGVQVQRGFGELRVAEARMEEEALIGTSVVDGEFWIWPPRIPQDCYPIFDDEETGVVVGFRSRGSVVSYYDLEGNLVGMTEPGLETPLLDPIDFLAGGLVGLGRSIVGSGARSAARGLAGGAGRSGARAFVAGAGLRVAASTIARSLLVAIRSVYRAIRFRGALNFTATTLARMADPARRVPHHILKLAIRFGARAADPQGVAGAFRYVIPMVRNGRQYTLEVVIREADQTVLHFLYR